MFLISAGRKSDIEPNVSAHLFHIMGLLIAQTWKDSKTLGLVGLALLTFVLMIPSQGWAENISVTEGSLIEDDLAFLKEEEVVVTAILQEQPISEAPSNMYVITAEDIRHSGATDIPTLLRRVPGMEVMQTTGAEYNVSVRGNNQIGSNKLLVQVDGRSVYIDAAGRVYWRLLPVTVSEIQRIEILKGPASSIHGFNAFDGVVNIITKSPREKGQNTFQFVGGEFGTAGGTALMGGSQGSLGYRLSLGYDQNQQWRNRDGLAFRSYQANLRTEYDLSGEAKLTASGGGLYSNKFDGNIQQTTLDSTEMTQGYLHLGYQTTNFKIQGFWNGHYLTSKQLTHPLLNGLLQNINNNGEIESLTKQNAYDLMTQYRLASIADHSLLIGANYRLITVTSDLIDSFERENRLGLYLQDTWVPLPTLSLTVGARYDLDTFINPTLSPRGSLVWKVLPDQTIRLGISLGYRPPTLITTHLNIQNRLNFSPPVFFTVVGSDNVGPEQIIASELEYQGWFWQHLLRVRSSFFYNHISDLIEFVQTGPAPTDPVSAINNGEADIFGGELGLEYWVTSWISGYVNGAFQEIGQTIRGINERAGPRFKINGGLRAQSDLGLSGEVGVHFVSATTYPLASAFTTLAPFGVVAPDARVGPYTLLNVRVGYSFWNDQAEAAISVFNALNDRHKEHPLGDTIGSRVLGWLTLKFN
ncbi:MAG: TonB-dependent receptor [Nitrospirota bacterium]|nr:TonB-dependent receptor [Nitrospirota bacterium]MDH5774959.1 TonB-dependent receptor [Nitrospirota bacterium]